MTRTLTTEQLRARAKFWREKAVEAKWESVSIAQDMLQNADAFDELAANREAQPVAFTSPAQLKKYPNERREAYGQYSEKFCVPLYTAPPAPPNAKAVGYFLRFRVEWHTPSKWSAWTEIDEATYDNAVKIIATGEADAGRFYEARILYDAPPVPESTNAAGWGINMQTGTPILTYKKCSVIESEQAHYVLSLINGAAMPALAVPAQPLPADIEKYNQGIKDGLEWAARTVEANHPNTGDWLYDDRDDLAKAIRKGADMLAAAPEGGNGA